MLTLRLVGALLVGAGVVYLAVTTLYRGRLSDDRADPKDTRAHTLEPPSSGARRAFRARDSWPGFALVGLGILLLLLPLLGGPPQP